MIQIPRLYAIADASYGEPPILAQHLFEGGARLVQVRDKEAGAGKLLEQVERTVALAPPGALVIVNDRADVAWISGASGVHLGQSDLPVWAARRILSSRIIGVSTHNMAQAIQADSWPIDYIAVGPIFPTASKRKPDPLVGLAELAEICRRVQKPVVAIGGITLHTANSVFAAGASSVAVIRDLLKASDLTTRTKAWTELE